MLKAQEKLGMPIREYYIQNDIRKMYILNGVGKTWIERKYRGDLRNEFPYLYIKQSKSLMVFGKREYKEEFVSRMGITENGERYYEPKVLGEFLSYPPSAIEWYVEKGLNEDVGLGLAVEVSYKGIRFVTRRDLVRENVEWLDENVNIPVELGLGISVRSV